MNWKYALAALALAIAIPQVVAAQAPVKKQAPKVAPVQTPAQSLASQVSREMSRLAELAKPQLEAIQGSSALYMTVANQTAAMQSLVSLHATPAEVDQWLATWEPDLKAQIAAWRARAATLKPYSNADAPIIFASGAAEGIDVAALRQAPVNNRKSIEQILDQVERTAAAVHDAAYGDPAKLQKLRAELVAGDGVMIGVINANADLSIAMQPVGEPTRDFLQMIRSTNLTQLAFNDALAAEVAGRPVDSAGAASAMRQNLADTARYKVALSADLNKSLAQVSAGPLANTAAGRKLETMLGTYRESIANEDRVQLLFEQIAAGLAAGKAPSSLAGSLADYIELSKTRAEIIKRRQQAGA